MFIITRIIFILITDKPEQDRLAENQPTAGLSSLNEYENKNENGMGKSETELLRSPPFQMVRFAFLKRFYNSHLWRLDSSGCRKSMLHTIYGFSR